MMSFMKRVLLFVTALSLMFSGSSIAANRLIGLEDLTIGSGTYSFPTLNQTRTKINAGSLPFSNILYSNRNPNDWIDGGFDTDFKPGKIISGGPEVSIQKYDADNDSAISDSEFATAITEIGAASTALLVDAPVTVSANNTIPSNITLRFIRPGRLTINTGITLIMNSALVAPPYKIFTYNGTGTITFGDGVVHEVYAEWWGAQAGAWANTYDSTTAIQAALDSFAGGHTVQLLRGTYFISAQLLIRRHGTILRGSGKTHMVGGYGSYIRCGAFASGTSAIRIHDETSEVSLENFSLFGDSGAENTGTQNNGILVGLNSQHGTIKHVHIQNFRLLGAAGISFGAGGINTCWGWRVFSSLMYNNDIGIYIVKDNNDITLIGTSCVQNDSVGLYIESNVATLVNGGDYQSNGDYNIRIQGAKSLTIMNTYQETSNGFATWTLADHRSIYIGPYSGAPSLNVVLKNNLLNGSNPTDTSYQDYGIEILDDACTDCEISNNVFWKFNTSAIKNGTGNSGISIGNLLRNEGNNEAASYSKLFDNERGWQLTRMQNDSKGFIRSSNLARMSVPANATTVLRVFTMPEDSSALVKAEAVWRKQTAADTNTYQVAYWVERDGAGAPTIAGLERNEVENIAGQDLLFAINGNNVELQFTAAAGEPGFIYFDYKIMDIVEIP